MKLTFTVVFVALLLIECNDDEFAKFRQLSETRQHQVFDNMTLAEQIDLHLKAMSSEPPDTKYADWIAERGAEIIPVVLSRTDEQEDDSRRIDLLVIFEALCKTECANRYPDTFQHLKKDVEELHDPIWRKVGENKLNYMSGKPIPFPEVP